MEEHDYDFKAEYAKSNRASCKFCSGLIAKDSLRLAIMIQVGLVIRVNLDGTPTQQLATNQAIQPIDAYYVDSLNSSLREEVCLLVAARFILHPRSFPNYSSLALDSLLFGLVVSGRHMYFTSDIDDVFIRTDYSQSSSANKVILAAIRRAVTSLSRYMGIQGIFGKPIARADC